MIWLRSADNKQMTIMSKRENQRKFYFLCIATHFIISNIPFHILLEFSVYKSRIINRISIRLENILMNEPEEEIFLFFKICYLCTSSVECNSNERDFVVNRNFFQRKKNSSSFFNYHRLRRITNNGKWISNQYAIVVQLILKAALRRIFFFFQKQQQCVDRIDAYTTKRNEMAKRLFNNNRIFTSRFIQGVSTLYCYQIWKLFRCFANRHKFSWNIEGLRADSCYK